MPFSRILLPVCLLLIAACGATSTQRFPVPAVESSVAPTAARVYIARAEKTVGSLRDVRIYDNDDEVGTLTEGGYLSWDRAAERGTGKAVFGGYTFDGGEMESFFELPGVGGSTTYLLLRLEREDRKPTIEVLPEHEGRALIENRKKPVKG